MIQFGRVRVVGWLLLAVVVSGLGRGIPVSQALVRDLHLQPTALPIEMTPALTPTPPAPIPGELIAQVVNGTPGGAQPGDVPLTLYALSSDMETIVFTRTTQVDADGWAHLGDLDASADLLYSAVVDYGQASWVAQPQHFAPDQTTLTLTVTVYESTSDPTMIRVEQMHLIAQLQPGRVQIDEILIVSNASDRAYLDEEGLSLRVALPEAATNLQFQMGQLGENYQAVAGGFADTQAVPPGERTYQIVFSYLLAYDGKSLDVRLPLTYPVQKVTLLIRGEGMQVSSEQLTGGEVQQTPGGDFLSFHAGPLTPDQPLAFRLSGTSTDTPAATISSSSALIGALVGVLLVVLVLVLYIWRRSRRLQPVAAADRDALIDQIATLDDAYAAGQVTADDYESERKVLKTRLMKHLATDDDSSP